MPSKDNRPLEEILETVWWHGEGYGTGLVADMSKTYEQIRQECIDEIRAIETAGDGFAVGKIMSKFVDRMVEKGEHKLGADKRYIDIGRQLEGLYLTVTKNEVKGK